MEKSYVGVFESYPVRWTKYESRISLDRWRRFPIAEVMMSARIMTEIEFITTFGLPVLHVVGESAARRPLR